MEELLTRELVGELVASVDRARELLDQLVSDLKDDEPRPIPMRWEQPRSAGSLCCRLPNCGLPCPEIAIWGRDEVSLIGGRADALAIHEHRVDAVIDW